MLFRQEAIDHSTDKLGGDVLLLPKVSYLILTVLVSFWVVLVFYWLVTSQYSRKETVSGWVVPSSGVVRVYSSNENGVVAKVLVNEGQLVSQGEPLVVMKQSRALSGEGELSDLLQGKLVEQKKLVTAQLNRTKEGYTLSVQRLNDQLQSAESELIDLNTQLRSLDAQEELAKTDLEKFERLLRKKLVSQSEYDRSNRDYLSIRGNRAAIARSIKKQAGIALTLRNDIDRFPATHANELTQLESQISDLEQKILHVSADSEIVIKAPTAGRVDSIQGVIGQRIPSTKPILSLIPPETELKVNLLIPVRAIGFVDVGQTIDVRYDAFPYQKFGTYKAKVTQVPEYILLPNEIIDVPADVREAIYKVEAALEKEVVKAYGREVSLKSGMTLVADVYLGERSLLEWLLEPLYSLRGRLQ